LNSKSGQREANIKIEQLHQSGGEVEKAKLEMLKVSSVMLEITKLEQDLLQLGNAGNKAEGSTNDSVAPQC
jgi:hypothetical protein